VKKNGRRRNELNVGENFVLMPPSEFEQFSPHTPPFCSRDLTLDKVSELAKKNGSISKDKFTCTGVC
jgi:hypothetical protein